MTLPTPFYEADGVTLYCGDCREILPDIDPAGCVLVTDPPYGVRLGSCGDKRGGRNGMTHAGYINFDDTYEQFVAEIVPRLNMALDHAIRAAIFTGPHIHEQRKPTTIGGVFCPSGCGRTPWGFKTFLPVLLYGGSPTVMQGKGQTIPTCIRSSELPAAESKAHPVPKPLGWMMWLISLASLPGEMVLDPFAGSGTTLVAAKRLGRRAIGIEISPDYCAIIVERLRQRELFGSTP